MRTKEQSRLKWPYHSFSRALPMSTTTPLLVKLPSLGHQAHTEQLVHHACTWSLGCELLQDVTQHICGKSVFNHRISTQTPTCPQCKDMKWDTLRCCWYSVQYRQSLCTPRRASPAPAPAPQSKGRSGYLSFCKKNQKTPKGLFKKRFAADILTQCPLDTNNAVWTRSVWSAYFCFFSSLALSTRPMRTSCVTTCRRVRVLLLSNGSRVSTISGTKHQK